MLTKIDAPCKNVTLFAGTCHDYTRGISLVNFFQKGNAIMLFAPKEQGQGLVEYAIILALIAIVVIAVMRILGPRIGNTFSTINNSLL
jgi:pilus assembly protein Flp/PilA